MLPTQLSNDRIRLAPPSGADVPAITAICQDPEIQEWTTIPSPYTSEDATEFVVDSSARWINYTPDVTEGSPTWALYATELEGEPLIGMLSLVRDSRTGVVGEIGYWLSPEHRGHGYMADDVGMVLDFAFDTMELQSVVWRGEIHDGQPNWPSARVVWKNGFQFTGVVRGMISNKGKAYDCLVGSIKSDDPRTPSQPWNGPSEAHPAFPDPRDPEALVRQFHETYDLPIVSDGPNADRERIHMRMSLIAEEFAELTGAAYGQEARKIIEDAFDKAHAADDKTRDTVEIADALGDLIYVIYGAALELGIPMADVLAEIQASNLSKLGEDGKPIYREDGKVLKGANYFPPDIKKVLGL